MRRESFVEPIERLIITDLSIYEHSTASEGQFEEYFPSCFLDYDKIKEQLSQKDSPPIDKL